MPCSKRRNAKKAVLSIVLRKKRKTQRRKEKKRKKKGGGKSLSVCKPSSIPAWKKKDPARQAARDPYVGKEKREKKKIWKDLHLSEVPTKILFAGRERRKKIKGLGNRDLKILF